MASERANSDERAMLKRYQPTSSGHVLSSSATWLGNDSTTDSDSISRRRGCDNIRARLQRNRPHHYRRHPLPTATTSRDDETRSVTYTTTGWLWSVHLSMSTARPGHGTDSRGNDGHRSDDTRTDERTRAFSRSRWFRPTVKISRLLQRTDYLFAFVKTGT